MEILQSGISADPDAQPVPAGWTSAADHLGRAASRRVKPGGTSAGAPVTIQPSDFFSFRRKMDEFKHL